MNVVVIVIEVLLIMFMLITKAMMLMKKDGTAPRESSGHRLRGHDREVALPELLEPPLRLLHLPQGGYYKGNLRHFEDKLKIKLCNNSVFSRRLFQSLCRTLTWG